MIAQLLHSAKSSSYSTIIYDLRSNDMNLIIYDEKPIRLPTDTWEEHVLVGYRQGLILLY